MPLTLKEKYALIRFKKWRKDRAGFSKNFLTVSIHRGTTLPAVFPTGNLFPDRSIPIMFQTRIRILANGGIHRGCIFSMGTGNRGCAAWLANQSIGFTAGNGQVVNERATAVWNFGAELPPGREFQLTFAIKTGVGRIRIYDGGNRIADVTAVAGNFNGDWSNGSTGVFAALPIVFPQDVPPTSESAPNGFQVIEPLFVFNGQMPRSFV